MAQIRGSQISGSVASASYAATSSYALNAGSSWMITSGSVSASLDVAGEIFFIKSSSHTFFSVSDQGQVTVSGSADQLLTVKGSSNNPILTVSQSGAVVFATQSSTPTGTAPNGAVTFTSTDFFVGLD